jgi:hypothetical protein
MPLHADPGRITSAASGCRPVVPVAIAVVLAGALAMFGVSGSGHAAERGPTVVELYTSQGCSSCPPADRFLHDLADRSDVVALSFHVDYWDYIGWKDTFAIPEATERQRRYSQVLKTRYVYTPEMVIGGATDVVGSSRFEVEAAIRALRAAPSPGIEVALERRGADDGMVLIRSPVAEADADVWLVTYDREHTVEVRRGENAGRELTYRNVVRRIERIGTWTGGAARLPVDLGDVRRDGTSGCVAIVQQAGVGPILAAARLDVSRP